MESNTTTTTNTIESKKQQHDKELESINFKVLIPRVMLYKDPWNDSDDDEGDENAQFKTETLYTPYYLNARKGETLKEVFERVTLDFLGINEPYEIVIQPNGCLNYQKKSSFHHSCEAYSTVVYCKEFHPHGAAKECVFILEPRKQSWYKCVKLSQEEIKAARRVVDGVEERPCKRVRIDTEQ